MPAPAMRVRLKAPLTVLARRILPIPTPLFNVQEWVRVTGVAKEIDPLVVIILAPSDTPPLPFCVNALASAMLAPGEIVKAPEFVIVQGPVFVVVVVPLKRNVVPTKEMPSAAVVAIAPLNVVVPVPAICVSVPAEIAGAVTFVALVI